MNSSLYPDRNGELQIYPPRLLEFEEFEGFELNFDGLSLEQQTEQPTAINQKEKLTKTESKTEWLFLNCQDYTFKHQSMFDTVDLCNQILAIYKTSQHQRQKEQFFQDKMFQLLGEDCFELLSEISQNFDHLKGITSQSLADYGAKQLEASSAATTEAKDKDWLAQLGFSEEYLQNERALGLQKGTNFDNDDSWRDSLLPEGSRVYHEKRGLPAGSEKKVGPGYEEVTIPAATNKPIIPPGGLVKISSLEPFAQLAFRGTSSLNTIQSIVFQAAYDSAQNLLICAPTGAGKVSDILSVVVYSYLS